MRANSKVGAIREILAKRDMCMTELQPLVATLATVKVDSSTTYSILAYLVENRLVFQPVANHYRLP